MLFRSSFKKSAQTQIDLITEISERVELIKNYTTAMIEERKKANNLHDAKKEALAYCEKVLPFFDKIRYEVDKLELVVDDELWPLPKYREMLFTR